MDYTKLYHKMIQNALPRVGKKIHCAPMWERHHARPKAFGKPSTVLAKEFPKKLDGVGRLVVYLTTREHRVIHKVFYKAMVQHFGADHENAKKFAGDNYKGTCKTVAKSRYDAHGQHLRVLRDEAVKERNDARHERNVLKDELKIVRNVLDKGKENPEQISTLQSENHKLKLNVWEVKADAFDIINHNFKNKGK